MRYASGARILVTGATGFIGRAVTRRLLTAGERVTVLARCRHGAEAATRVAMAVGSASRSGDLAVVEGDLREPRAGLGSTCVAQLRATIDTVIHCAGDPEFFPEHPQRFRAAHVDGPTSLLESLAVGRLATWAHLSTAYVCGRRTGTVLEREADVGQDFHNPYERVKLEAEMAIRAAGERHGVDVRVFRPSAVVGRATATAGGSPSAVLFQFIRLVATLADAAPRGRLTIAASGQARFNIVPLGYVARSLAALARCPRGAGGTFHLVVADPPRQDAVLRTIAVALRARGVSLGDGPAHGGNWPTFLERRVHRMMGPYRGYLNQDVRFDDANARELLAPHGVAPPSLDGAALRRLVGHALRGRGAENGAPAVLAPR